MAGIPCVYIAQLIEEWKRIYGPTFPLYGKETTRHDISGSVRPLLQSTEIAHIEILAVRAAIPKKQLLKIVNAELEEITFDMADKIVQATGLIYAWYEPPLDAYYF